MGKQNLVNILKEEGNVSKKYRVWQKEVNVILDKCKRKQRKSTSKKSKIVRKLMKAKRRFRIKGKNEPNIMKKRLATAQEKLIDEYIIEEKK